MGLDLSGLTHAGDLHLLTTLLIPTLGKLRENGGFLTKPAPVSTKRIAWSYLRRLIPCMGCVSLQVSSSAAPVPV